MGRLCMVYFASTHAMFLTLFVDKSVSKALFMTLSL
jgi:hypothetical protein